MVNTQPRSARSSPEKDDQAGEDADEGLAGEVVGLLRAVQAQVAGDGRGEVAVEDLERPGRARLGGGEDVVEGQSRWHAPPPPDR